jgi:branched-chain amino acid transport system ATP-binding protein
MTVIENLCVPLEYSRRERGHGRHVRDDAMSILELVGVQDRAADSKAPLKQVDLRNIELARELAESPANQIADEAMAGLSSSEVDDILTILFRLNERGVAVIMIEHIMRAVMRFSERIVVLDAGQKIAEGNG